ncbi:hypothetical protein [Demequina gelatinilytica]|uniref:hypothetical protein n=1 Tax=Demequina gelatinilytica TaxID=1638980 RepID=UPI000784B82B|nr:hypothetical protein [Demequina gelatinilytica]
MTSTTDEDRAIDRLLRGDTPAELADLGPAVAALRGLAIAAEPAHAARVGAALASVAAGSRTPLSREPAAASSPWRSRVASMSALALLIGGTAAGAAAADPAAPGDPLYSIDRAFERIGLRDGGNRERVAEALRLDGKGDYGDAIEHVAEAADIDTDSSEALLETARALRAESAEASDEVRRSVTDLLEWMETADFADPGFGAHVTARVRSIPTPAAPPQEPVIDARDADGQPDAGEAAGKAAAADGQPDAGEAAGKAAAADAPPAAADGTGAETSDGGSWSGGWRGAAEPASWSGERWSDGEQTTRDWSGRTTAGAQDSWQMESAGEGACGADSGTEDVGASPMPDKQSGSEQAFSPKRP